MRISASIFTIAVGAILRFAVDVHTKGFNVHTIGVILMAVGALGGALTLILWNRPGPGVRGQSVVRDTYTSGPVLDGPVVSRGPVTNRTVEEQTVYDDPRSY